MASLRTHRHDTAPAAPTSGIYESEEEFWDDHEFFAEPEPIPERKEHSQDEDPKRGKEGIRPQKQIGPGFKEDLKQVPLKNVDNAAQSQPVGSADVNAKDSSDANSGKTSASAEAGKQKGGKAEGKSGNDFGKAKTGWGWGNGA